MCNDPSCESSCETIDNLHRYIEDLEHEINDYRGDLIRVKEERDELKEEIKYYIKSRYDLRVKMHDLINERDNMDEIIEERDALKEERIMYLNWLSEKEEILEQMRDLFIERDELIGENDDLMDEINLHANDNNKLKDERDDLITKNSQLLNTIAELNSKLQSVTKTKDANIDSDERAKIIAAYKDIFEMHIQQAKIANDNIISFLS